MIAQSFLTISGCTAPAPGITFVGGGALSLQSSAAHDIIMEFLRVRGGIDDNIRVWSGSDATSSGPYNIVLSRLSSGGAYDGNIDVTGSYDVTVEWSILGPHAHGRNQLVAYRSRNVSLHHNLYFGSDGRNPLISNAADLVEATGTVAQQQPGLQRLQRQRRRSRRQGQYRQELLSGSDALHHH